MLPMLLPLIASVAPDLIGHFVGGNAQAVAQKAADIAMTVTGHDSPESAIQAINSSPELSLQYGKALLDNRAQLEQIAAQRAKDDADADNKADELMTQRMALLEGTASDLKGIPYLGPFMLWLRGSQRIVIGYGCAWADWVWLTGGMGTLNDMQQRMLFTASLLVFVVLFGERAVKNVAPLVIDLLGARK